MTAFAAAMNVLFFDPNISAAATYIRAGEVSREVRVVLSRPDVIQDFSSARVQTDTVTVDVRTSDIAEPRRGDVLVINGERRVVQGVPIRDRDRLVWALDTRAE